MQLPLISVDGIPSAMVSPLDRGFTYGDGLFETCRYSNGQIPFWAFHRDRLLRSAQQLKIPLNETVLQEYLGRLVAQCRDAANYVIKIQVTRGVADRGYRLNGEVSPTYVMSVYPGGELQSDAFRNGVDVRVCDTRMGVNPGLAGIKHLNRLEQVMARAEWDAEFAEGLMLDTHCRVIEGTASNVFLVKDGVLITPDLSGCGVAGVMRRIIIERLAPLLHLPLQITTVGLEAVALADEVFLSNSVFGIWPVNSIAGLAAYKGQSITRQLQAQLLKILNDFDVERVFE